MEDELNKRKKMLEELFSKLGNFKLVHYDTFLIDTEKVYLELPKKLNLN